MTLVCSDASVQKSKSGWETCSFVHILYVCIHVMYITFIHECGHTIQTSLVCMHVKSEKRLKMQQETAKQIPVKNGSPSQTHTSLFIAHRVTFSQRCHQPWNFPSIFCQEMVCCRDKREVQRAGTGEKNLIDYTESAGGPDICFVVQFLLMFPVFSPRSSARARLDHCWQ